MAKLNFMAAVGASALMIAGLAATPSAAQYRSDRGYEQDRANRGGDDRDDRRGDDRDDDDRGRYGRDNRYDPRGAYNGALTSAYVDSLEWRINNAASTGQISRGQAQQLMREYRQVQESAHRVQTGQASRRERDRLAHVVQRIEAATTQRGYQGRGPRYGYNNR